MIGEDSRGEQGGEENRRADQVEERMRAGRRGE